MKNLLLTITTISLFTVNISYACTNIIVTKGASNNESVMITYAADSHIRYGYLFHYPAKDNAPGATTDIIHYENGKLLGRIPDVPHTFSVIGFMNEYQVAIGETTFGGLDSLQSQSGAILDYGSLMKLALQRATTAREAIKVITELVEKYGYASSGESFSISDKNEAWIMEIIGKGNFEKGAVWIALQIPDGYISGHANQARITTFAFQKKNDWNNLDQKIYHSPDIINFAKKHGWYKGSDANFSFSDIYNPVNFGGARFCDARIWSFFRKVNAGIRENPLYTEYALGNLYHNKTFPDKTNNPNNFVTNRLPLWVKPDKKVSLSDVMSFMRDHYEDTPLDMHDGVGAGPFACPYRWRPMEFTVDSVLYLNERAIATQQTGYSFVAQSRASLPNPIGGIFWFGVDDTDGCVYAPMYCGIKEIPSSYAFGNGSMISWSDSSAFWTFNLVNNFCYTRYNMIHPEVEAYQQKLEKQFIANVEKTDQQALALYSEDPQKAARVLTDFSVSTGNQLVYEWRNFFHYLFMKYMDGNLKQSENQKLKDNGNGMGIPLRPSHPGYGNNWERRMIDNTGNRYKVKETPGE